MTRYEERYRHGPSLFFPIALITVGVVWLLELNGVIPAENIYRLLPYWPVLLILAGLSVLFRRIWWPINALIWGGAAVLLVAALIAPPAFLPQPAAVEMKHQTLREPVGGAQTAVVQLHLSVNPATVHALTGGTDLVVADLYSPGDLQLKTSGAQAKTVRLENDNTFNMSWWRFDQWFNQANQPWDIGLNNSVPLDLTINASTGQSTLDLTGLKLTALAVDASTGRMDIKLPQGQAVAPIKVKASTGSMTVQLAADTAVDLNYDASTGSITTLVPAGAGVQVNVTDGGTGGLHLPADYKKTQGDTKDKEGVYQNDAFASAKAPVKITVDMSTGSFNVK